MYELNPQVKVKAEVEEVVRELAKELGYQPFTIRNVALVYGLLLLSATRRVPSEGELRRLLKTLGVRVRNKRWLVKGG